MHCSSRWYGFVKLTGFTPNLGKMSMAALHNFNSLDSCRDAENILRSVNETMPVKPIRQRCQVKSHPFRATRAV